MSKVAPALQSPRYVSAELVQSGARSLRRFSQVTRELRCVRNNSKLMTWVE
jgi:hypothetical protein